MIKPKIVSLFSGVGGLDLGFVDSGFDVSLAIDSDPAAVLAYNLNFGHRAKTVDVTSEDYYQSLNEVGHCDVLLGGFPCQGFSKAGPKRIDDVRNTLYLAMIQALEKLRPPIFIAENVDGLSQNFNGEMLSQIVQDCEQSGYKVEWKILDASWFGVPQHRRRIIIVGIREDLANDSRFIWPVAEYRPVLRNGERNLVEEYPSWASQEDLKPPQTLRDALVGAQDKPDHVLDGVVSPKVKAILSRIGPEQKLCNVRHDKASVRTWDIPDVFGVTSAKERLILETIARNRRHRKFGDIPNGNPLAREVIETLAGVCISDAELRSLSDRRYLKCIDEKWDISGAKFASGIFRRPALDSPSPTVLTSFHNARFMAHPVEPRPFSIREVARLQSFPDSFQFLSAGVEALDAYRLIGNAVPPRLAKKVAESARTLLQGLEASDRYNSQSVAK
ncbi:DNA (cytosine-5-)-methyltransferase [Leucobacter sp. UT-8R-CII-1-4]|uniref:DNA cytosine methyltransferase n=1 Tax=Leucobacter sp. UT-8R-CII-1-4 TaxID=3040075 RepID=UPI0024A92A88|nr:DNA (cytosine-5-)-methyltransferase [Leucobacter sp. UT-8R-CII-1-4]MDI6022412.1 DNA (cytosine-5-)-methyltransferase [Leucobacter sp. UT-8R-CII-1-4]